MTKALSIGLDINDLTEEIMKPTDLHDYEAMESTGSFPGLRRVRKKSVPFLVFPAPLFLCAPRDDPPELEFHSLRSQRAGGRAAPEPRDSRSGHNSGAEGGPGPVRALLCGRRLGAPEPGGNPKATDGRGARPGRGGALLGARSSAEPALGPSGAPSAAHVTILLRPGTDPRNSRRHPEVGACRAPLLGEGVEAETPKSARGLGAGEGAARTSGRRRGAAPPPGRPRPAPRRSSSAELPLASATSRSPQPAARSPEPGAREGRSGGRARRPAGVGTAARPPDAAHTDPGARRRRRPGVTPRAARGLPACAGPLSPGNPGRTARPAPRQVTQRAPGQRLQRKRRRRRAGVPGIPPWCRRERGTPGRGDCAGRRRPGAGQVPRGGNSPGRASRRSGRVAGGEGGGRGSAARAEPRLRVPRQRLLENAPETHGGAVHGAPAAVGECHAAPPPPRATAPRAPVTARDTCPRTLLRDGRKTWGSRNLWQPRQGTAGPAPSTGRLGPGAHNSGRKGDLEEAADTLAVQDESACLEPARHTMVTSLLQPRQDARMLGIDKPVHFRRCFAVFSFPSSFSSSSLSLLPFLLVLSLLPLLLSLWCLT
ncbi:uncharacterized protein LOC141583882 [Saimiri boliviensis]|uniref:uncharacterized protein LOC141583882 n=1 Tax=Saimiri boliviensis TaxID=27679 RepID=UPI003D772D3E